MNILISCCLITAALFIYIEQKEKFVPAAFLKGLASLFFVILGLRAHAEGTITGTIITGLCLGAAADVLLALRYVFPKKGKLVFLTGILVFLAGHIAYLAAILPMNSSPFTGILSGIALTALLMRFIFARITAEKAFRIFGIVYIGTITILNCIAFSNLFASYTTFKAFFAAGAFLFLISDIVLILNTFGKTKKFSLRITNLSLYYIGQILIALSLYYL